MKKTFHPSALIIMALDVDGCAAYGLREMETALQKQGVTVRHVNHWSEAPAEPVVVVGTTQNRRVQILLENEGVAYRLPGESLFVRWCRIPGGTVLLLAGTDEAGLMYNLLEMARQVEVHGLSALNEAADLTETPHNRVRCVDRYLLGHLDDEWFKSEAFWHYLLGRMARARFNRFCLIVGFDTAYMSPPYPFFVPVPGYPAIEVKGLTRQGMEENLAALRRLGDLCHEYGMKLVLATWQQRPWTARQDQLVHGLPEEVKGLSEYCYTGLKSLITAVPEIDIIQFRVNHESGVGDQVSAEDFWKRCIDAVADVAAETGRGLTLDLRAKGLTDSMIAHAFSQGLPVEVPAKYWCEHAALPYHLSVMRTEELTQLDNLNHSRRYSYADMLKKPKYYDVIYRLWNYGSTNLFLWGDADYARRFSLSCGLSGSAGFQINTPLSLKYGHEFSHKIAWNTFAKPELRYGEWEDERFWMWYTAFGRLGYNPDTEPAVWQEEFAAHFGAARGSLMERALAAASRIVPMVTTVHMPQHPSMLYWTEMNTGWALFAENNLYKPEPHVKVPYITYGSTEPSDHGLFYGIDEYAADCNAGKYAGKYTPLQYAEWLDQLAEETENLLASADEADGKNGAEYLAFRVDLSMLCDFSRYHAEKIRAALALALWRECEQSTYLVDAATLLNSAIGHWEALSEKGRENYYHDLNFSSAGAVTRRGTWGDLTKELLADRASLVELLKRNNVPVAEGLSTSYRPAPLPLESCRFSAAFPECADEGKALRIEMMSAGVVEPETLPILHYRHMDQTEGLFHSMEMERTPSGYAVEIPGHYVSAQWDLQIYITVQGVSGVCLMLPGVYHPSYPYPYHVIAVR